MTAEFDASVRLHLYRSFLETGAPEAPGPIAAALGRTPAEIEESYRRLAEGRAIVLEPGTTNILMANPLSAVPTRFRATFADGHSYFGNCIWDVLGIPAMLGRAARIEALCGDCDEPIALEARGDGSVAGEGVVHFGIPAARWWDDIVFT